MQPSNEMQHALRSLQLARRVAIETLKRDFSDLYVLSVQAFDIDGSGSNEHHMRLGEYLTEWSNALGSSPLEALAQGFRNRVFRELAERAGYEPDSAEITEIDEAPQPERLQSDDQSAVAKPAYLAYCNYYATGEGVTVFVAVAGTEERAKDAFVQNTPAYFQQGMELDVLGEEPRADTRRMERWIPQAALDLVAENLPGTTYYYAKLHFNLA